VFFSRAPWPERWAAVILMIVTLVATPRILHESIRTGAMGFLFEQGKITRPVHELTIAGNLREMFASISHIGNDMEYFSSLAVPSIAIQEMTVAA